jgi:hypothetical protein
VKHRNLIRIILTIGLFGLLCVLYFLKLSSSFHLNSDFGRDIFEMQKIINGDFTLIGPRLSFGLYYSPLYFYFFVPVLALFGQSPISIVYANALLFTLASTFLYLYLSRKKNLISSFIFILALSLLPLSIYSGRNPGNALSYIPFFMCLICAPLAIKKPSTFNLVILGILSFICLSFHPVAIFGVAPILIWLIISNRKNLFKLIYYLVPTILFVLPMFIFELRHGFIISRNFANQISSIKSLPLNNLNFINQIVVSNYSPYILILILTALLFFILNFKKYSAYEKVVSFWTVFTYLIFIFMIPKYEGSYLIPLNILLGLSLYIAFIKSPNSIIYLASLLLLIASNFPGSIYTISKRPISKFENAATDIAKRFPNLINKKFNVLQVSDPNIVVPVGHEFRFFLRKQGLTSLPETNYSEATTLLIYSEIGDIAIEKIDNWEINQFGKKFTIKQHEKLDGLDIYMLSK